MAASADADLPEGNAAPDVLADPCVLAGRWGLARSIDDRITGQASTVTGYTELTVETADRVRWDEAGTLTMGGREYPVSRTLVIARHSDVWMVTFADGRPFHPWTPGEHVVHPCGADLYVGSIDALPESESESGAGVPARWMVEWTVTGPRKDYTMTTLLTRRVDGPDDFGGAAPA